MGIEIILITILAQLMVVVLRTTILILIILAITLVTIKILAIVIRTIREGSNEIRLQ